MPVAEIVEAMPSDSPIAPPSQVFHLSAPVLVPAGSLMKVPIFVFGLRPPLAKLTVALHIRHDAGGMLALALASPDGTVVLLSTIDRNDGRELGESCARPLVFDDEADRLIAEARPPYAGPHRPQQPLDTYRAPGCRLNGVWHLLLSDSGAGRTRTLVADAALAFRT